MFKPGDKVICLDTQDREEDLVYGAVYTVLMISTSGGIIRMKELGYAFGFSPDRFKLYPYSKKIEVKNKPFIE